MENSTVEGYCYFITFTDDYSQYTHIGFCKTKDNTLAAFKTWKAQAKKETGKVLKILHTDGGGEYTSHAFSAYLAENGIKHELTNVYTPQENRVSEHANQTINNLTWSMLADAKETIQEKSLLLALWSHAVSHAVWVKNCILTCVLQSPMTPYQVYFGRKPDLPCFGYLVAKPTCTFQRSINPSIVNDQLNAYMLDLCLKRVAICSTIARNSTYLNPGM